MEKDLSKKLDTNDQEENKELESWEDFFNYTAKNYSPITANEANYVVLSLNQGKILSPLIKRTLL